MYTVWEWCADAVQELSWSRETPVGAAFERECLPEGRPLSNHWNPPEMFVQQPLLPAPDIWPGIIGAPILEEHVVDALRPLLEPVGELLPIPFEDRILYAFNVTYLVACLDESKSNSMMLQYVFRDIEQLEHSVFKVPQEPLSPPFSVRGMFPPERDFIVQYESHGFTGLWFRELECS